MATDTGIHPNCFTFDETNTVWKCKYEIIQWDGTFDYPNAVLSDDPNISALFDFVGGLPYAVIEIMSVLYQGQLTTGFTIVPQEGISQPVPSEFFTGMGEEINWNLIWLAEDETKVMLDSSMDGESDMKIHWYIRTNYSYLKSNDAKKRWPIPGNMVCLTIRVFPDLPSGMQKSSPFIVSGNMLDTVYYTRGRVTEILPPSGNRCFPYYRVQWRKNSKNDTTDTFLAKPSGFETYAVDDYVTILKDAATVRTSQKWTDAQTWQTGIWRIIPVSFYTQTTE